MTSQQGAAPHDESLGFSAAGCVFTALGFAAAALPLVGMAITGGGASVWVALAGLLAIAGPLALILGSRFEEPTRFGMAYFGLVAAYWVAIYAF